MVLIYHVAENLLYLLHFYDIGLRNIVPSVIYLAHDPPTSFTLSQSNARKEANASYYNLMRGKCS